MLILLSGRACIVSKIFEFCGVPGRGVDTFVKVHRRASSLYYLNLKMGTSKRATQQRASPGIRSRAVSVSEGDSQCVCVCLCERTCYSEIPNVASTIRCVDQLYHIRRVSGTDDVVM